MADSLSREPSPLPPEERQQAADFVVRFLAQPRSVALGMVRELTDAEVAAIVAAGRDRYTARQQIKDVLSRAFDRRRESSAQEASAEMAAAVRSARARRAIEQLGMFSSEQAHRVVTQLTPEEVQRLSALADAPDSHDAVGAILTTAADRQQAERAATGAEGGPP